MRAAGRVHRKSPAAEAVDLRSRVHGEICTVTLRRLNAVRQTRLEHLEERILGGERRPVGERKINTWWHEAEEKVDVPWEKGRALHGIKRTMVTLADAIELEREVWRNAS